MPYNLRISILRKEPLMCVFHPLIEMDVVSFGIEKTVTFTCESVLNCYYGKDSEPEYGVKWWPDWLEVEEVEFCDLLYNGHVFKKADLLDIFSPIVKMDALFDEASLFLHRDMKEDVRGLFSGLGWDENDEDAHYIKDIRVYYSVCENKKEVLKEKKKVGVGGMLPFCVSRESDFPDLKIYPTEEISNILISPDETDFCCPSYCFIYPNQNKRRERNDVLQLDDVRNMSFVIKSDVGSTLEELNDYYYGLQREIRKNFERRYKRGSADVALDKFFKVVKEINSNPNAIFTVRDVVIFGSYVNTDNEKIGDIDIAIAYTEHIERRKGTTYADYIETVRLYENFWKMLKVSPIIELHSLDDYLNVCETYHVPVEELLNKHRAYSVNQNEELVPCLLKNVLENYIATKCKGVKTPSTAFAESSLGKLYRNE